MTYSQPLSYQVSLFLSSVGFGFALGIYYDVIRAFFYSVSTKRRSVFVCDMIFGITGSVAAFFFMVLYCEGRVRLHLCVGILAGLAVFHLTVGKYIFKALGCLLSALKKGFLFLLSPFITVGGVFACGMSRQAEKIASGLKKRAVNADEDKKSEKKSLFFKNIVKTYLKKSDKSV